MGREDHRAGVDRVQALEPAVTVDQLDPVCLEFVGHVGVVNEVTEHPDLFARPRLGRLLGGADRLHDAVAVATRRDLEAVHRFESTRDSKRRIGGPGYGTVSALAPDAAVPASAARAAAGARGPGP